MLIEYYKKDSYGNTHCYIKPKTTAKQIALLLKKKTIDRGDMDILTRLFEVKFIQVLAPEEEMPF